jgi:hypothetical protein
MVFKEVARAFRELFELTMQGSRDTSPVLLNFRHKTNLYGQLRAPTAIPPETISQEE